MPDAILALNAGSSSIKFGLFEVREGSGIGLMSKGGIEGICGDPHFTATGADGSKLEDKRWRGKDAEYGAMLGALLARAEGHVKPDSIASLTGVPNLITALRLAAQGRGPAVVSETYNSNSLNLIFGACLPTIFLPLSVLSPMGLFAMWWMAGATLLSGALVLRAERLGRLGGVALVASWIGFATIIVMR